MLYINSIAAVTGPTDFTDLLPVTAQGRGRSILQHAYLRETGNRAPEHARFQAVLSSSELAASAVLSALERAGISTRDIGLLIGDTTNPKELIPSESQRVGRELAVKVASFDVGTGGVGLPAMLAVLNSWKKERLEKPIVFFTVHTPSLAMNLSLQGQPCIFSDAAFACVVSLKPDGYALEAIHNEILPAEQPVLRIPGTGFMTVPNKFFTSIPGILAKLVEELDLHISDTILASTFGVPAPETFQSVYSQYGEALGASVGIGLEERTVKMQSGDRVALLVPGCGSVAGGCVLKKI